MHDILNLFIDIFQTDRMEMLKSQMIRYTESVAFVHEEIIIDNITVRNNCV